MHVDPQGGPAEWALTLPVPYWPEPFASEGMNWVRDLPPFWQTRWTSTKSADPEEREDHGNLRDCWWKSRLTCGYGWGPDQDWRLAHPGYGAEDADDNDNGLEVRW